MDFVFSLRGLLCVLASDNSNSKAHNSIVHKTSPRRSGEEFSHSIDVNEQEFIYTYCIFTLRVKFCTGDQSMSKCT